ncbi:MAG: hypothetical protein IT546_16440 [Caulobacteraceae bacterium]|nr:hypothetical protein [Caulobacteraceae bacterium]
MMDYLGRLADDLTEIIEELERPVYLADSEALRRALEKAVAEANRAARTRRKRLEGEAPLAAARRGG